MSQNKSISRTLFISISMLLTVLIFIFGGFWIWEKSQVFEQESEQIRHEYLVNQKAYLKEKVDHIASYVEFKKSQAVELVKEEVKSRTEEAYAVADHIYHKYKGLLPLNKIKERVHDALFAATWDNNTGYYFAEDMQGTEIINRNNPELEGTNIWNIQDVKGTFLMQEIIKVAKSDTGEGFTTYYWNKPGSSDITEPKISYVKYFKPFDWVIGNGKYLKEKTAELKREVLERIESVRFGDNNYFFVATYEGVSLTGVFIGKNMWEVQDSNGVKLVQELIKVAKSGGGFVHYVMPKHKGKRPDPKLSYAKGIPDWEWYVGAGLYIDDIEQVIADRQVAFRSQLIELVVRTIGMFMIVLILLVLITWGIFRKLNEHLSVFGSFFKNSAVNTVKIDLNELEFSEFRVLAESANEMIDSQQKAHQALAESEKRFIKMVELAPIPMILTSSKGVIEYVNKQFVHVFGYKHEEISDVGMWMRLAYPDASYRQQVNKVWKEALEITTEESDPYQTEVITVRTATGEFLNVKFVYTPVGKRGLTVAYDVTSMLRSEKERTKLLQQLHQAQKMEAIGMMAGGVAHDLNNILSGVVSYPEILLMKLPEDSDLRSPLQSIHDAGIRAAEVVADLLTVARGVASEKDIIDLNMMVEEYVNSPEFKELTSRFPEVDISVEYAKTELHILCSKTHVKKTVMNLVSNAAEAIQGKGCVQLSISFKTMDSCIINNQALDAGDYVVLTVADNGPGIDADDISHIFEPFYSKKVMGFSGTGLGLSIVWNTMLDHHGAVDVSSSPEGSVFKLYFHLEKADMTSNTDTQNSGVFYGEGQRILVVDDEAIQRDVADQMLTSLGYHVETVASGEEAIKKLETTAVDLVLLDMIMVPGIGGCETYEEILKINPEQKALIASGYTDNDEVKRIQEMGAGPYIKKPYTIQQLGKVVKEVLDGR